MILESIKQIPFIHFGFSVTKKTVAVDEEVIFYIDNNYSLDNYDVNIAFDTGGSLTKINDNKYSISFDSIGVKNLSFNLASKKLFTEKTSNNLEITVV